MARASGMARMSPSLAQLMQPRRLWTRGYTSSAKNTSPSPAKLTGSAIWSGVKFSPPCSTEPCFRGGDAPWESVTRSA